MKEDGSEIGSLKAGFVVDGSELVLVRPRTVEKLSAAPQDIALDVRYEDDDLLVVNKPAGMVVHPAPGHPDETLANAVAAHCGSLSDVNGPIRPGILHRLDKDTSGLLLVLKNNVAHRALAEQLAERTLKREYLALVWGTLDPEAGRIEADIGRHRNDGKLMPWMGASRVRQSRTTGRSGPFGTPPWCSSAWKPAERTRSVCISDTKDTPSWGTRSMAGGRDPSGGVAPTYRTHARELLKLIDRQALHAFRVSFTQPTTGKRIEIEADPPEDFASAVEFAETFRPGT